MTDDPDALGGLDAPVDRAEPRDPNAPGDLAGASRAVVSRRSVLFGAGGAVAGLAGGSALGWAAGSGRAAQPAVAAVDPAPANGRPVGAAGRHQAGVVTPSTPQPHGLLAVWDLGSGAVDLGAVRDLLAAVGVRILELTSTPARSPDVAALLPDGPGDLTVTVGAGPRILAAADRALPGAKPLPRFAHDDKIDPSRVGGDLLLALHASDPSTLAPTLAALESAADDAAPGLRRRRWTERCFRAPGEGTVARNPLGYLDGIRVPRSEEELAENVWLGKDDHPAAAGGTVMVLRRLVLDVARFGSLSAEDADAVVGRHRTDGSPLSGGGRDADVDLQAKTPEGRYVTPARSHARAAHPSFTGSALMLRRSYTFAGAARGADGAEEQGLFFLCFQRSLDTFVRTQQRLDEVDDLMAFARPTASANFLVLPGFTQSTPLGATIFQQSH